ncbi:hypothetical protein [Bifidobacterium sp. ESL0732]|uniref:hypothetical protein n=1 Tax=Bifidobacterium sp. ESL0732 TaxID=2983222 RepID=UPI0023F956B1|nr:hypothetical protein [Bifidobacterium sp. ESL0732]WEV64788.1 hypothetical protein OZX70_04265 [Bifidobacterium sp. ESL0732]
MGNIDIVVAVIIGVIGFAIGIIFGAIPAFSNKMDENQNRWQQWSGVFVLLVFFLLMYFKLNIASWSLILATIAGFAIAKIPPLHRWLLARFPMLRPKQEEKQQPRPAQYHKPRKKNGKKRKHTH